MSTPLVYEGSISAATVISNLPKGRTAFLRTIGGNIGVEWYDKRTNGWTDSATVSEPGGDLFCSSHKARLTPAAPSAISIFLKA